MATALNSEMLHLRQRVARFAEREIADRPDLLTEDEFPRSLWLKMAQEGLLKVAPTASSTASDGGHLSAVVTLEALASAGRSMGLSFSLAIHLLVSRLIHRFGNDGQRSACLDRMAEGELIVSLAVSEPGAGAHPKHLTTNAQCTMGPCVLNGRKTHLTNGPVADLFIVFAVTGQVGARKRFSAFLVPRGADGLHIGGPMRLGFLRPSLHCEIGMEDCRIPASSLLGERGSAYEAMAVPFRESEDVYLMGVVCGGMQGLMNLLLARHRSEEHAWTDEEKRDWGEMSGLVHALRVLAYEAACMLEKKHEHPEFLPLLTGFRSIAARARSVLARIMDSAPDRGVSPEIEIMANDLTHTATIAQGILQTRQQKLGEALLTHGGF